MSVDRKSQTLMDSIALSQWASTRFHTSDSVQAALASERDNGILSFNDYQACVDFFPQHKHDSRKAMGAGFVAAVSVVPINMLRKSPWPTQRVMWTSMAAYFFGRVAHLSYVGSQHLNFVRSLENPEGFAAAMLLSRQSLKTRQIPLPPNRLPVEEDSGFGNSWGTGETQTRQRQTPPSAEMPITTSKWDELRAKNSRNNASSSTWDAIRQSQERRSDDSVPQNNNQDRQQ